MGNPAIPEWRRWRKFKEDGEHGNLWNCVTRNTQKKWNKTPQKSEYGLKLTASRRWTYRKTCFCFLKRFFWKLAGVQIKFHRVNFNHTLKCSFLSLNIFWNQRVQAVRYYLKVPSRPGPLRHRGPSTKKMTVKSDCISTYKTTQA